MLEPLKILRKIYQQAVDLESPADLLELIVDRVRKAMDADVCSIYLLDEVHREWVLEASRGLAPASVGKVRLPEGEGLVGYVAQQRSLLNLANGASHSAYRFFPETGEERYPAFVGVPVISFRKLLGVMVVQRTLEKVFSDEQEAFLVTIAAQLAGSIREIVERRGRPDDSNASRSSGRKGKLAAEPDSNLRFKGVKGAAGLAIGTIHWISHSGQLMDHKARRHTDSAGEISRFRKAMLEARKEFRDSGDKMEGSLPRDLLALYNVYQLILEDRELVREIENGIEEGWSAETALKRTIDGHARIFQDMDDAYLQAKAEDIRHIGERVYACLTGSREARSLPRRGPIILMGRNLNVADIAAIPARRLAGLISTTGSALSHLAILANALGIPAVMGIGDVKGDQMQGVEAVVDGYRALAILNPVANLRREYRKLAQQEKRLVSGLGDLRDLPAMTTDGFRVNLLANTGLLADISPGLNNGAEGVGLYRSEIPFMVHDSFPSEDEQTGIYRKILEAYAPRLVCMRTLDIGGDKPLPYYKFSEDNPFLGWRGIRFTLDNTGILMTQVRAMLKASSGLDNLRILLPMVSQVEEVSVFRELLGAARNQLGDEYADVRLPEVGAMIEVPSVMHVFDQLAREVQFVSIGSNDFTQYLLAVDRNNAKVSDLYDWLNPAVLRALDSIVKSARKHHLSLSLCGEMAADPCAVLLLIGMGIETLSLSAYNIPKTKWIVRTVSRSDCERALRKALKMKSRHDIRSLLEDMLDQRGLGGLIRPGAI